MVQGIRDLVELPDPVNKTILKRELDTGLILEKISCPIGVVGVIFEARPDVIAQISALAIKSGNAVILKGGKEAVNTNKIIFELIKTAAASVSKFPSNALQQVFTRDDEEYKRLCKELKSGNWFKIRGYTKNDQFAKELVLNARDIIPIDKKE
jgi:glutamate-5-semialdehyde dehydrogenase